MNNNIIRFIQTPKGPEFDPVILACIYARKQEMINNCVNFRFDEKTAYYKDPVMALISEFSELLTNLRLANKLDYKQCRYLMNELRDQLCERALETFEMGFSKEHQAIIDQFFPPID